MHPDPALHLDEPACRVFAADVVFAQVFVHGPAGAAMVHAPLKLDGGGALPMLDSARAIAGIGGPGGYVSPDRYVTPGRVPTWNYVAVEAEGPVVRLSDDALVTHVDQLGARHGGRLAPKPVWTRDKMPAGRFGALARGIAGFAIAVEEWRGTARPSQNKPPRDVAGVVAGLRAAGRADTAGLVERARRNRA